MDVNIEHSCRICKNSVQDEENYVCLLDDVEQLSESGQAYEELMDLKIITEDMYMYPLILCVKCDLLLKLFKKLKERGKKTLKAIQESFEEALVEKLEDDTVITDSIEEKLEVQQEQNDDDENIFTNVVYLDNAENVDLIEKSADTHVNRKRKNVKGADCNYCGLHFISSTLYRRHRKEVHQNLYPCVECDTVLSNADALRVHMKTHNGETDFKCDICGHEFYQKIHWERHMNRHNNVRPFKCEHCGKSYLCKADLVIHIRTHTGDKRHKCNICGKVFLLFQHLKMHNYSHTGRKNFNCDICGKYFVSPSTLRVHKKSVHEDKHIRYECEICGKLFKRKHCLKSHLNIHEKKTAPMVLINTDVIEHLEEEAVDDVALESTSYTDEYIENIMHEETQQLNDVNNVQIIHIEQYVKDDNLTEVEYEGRELEAHMDLSDLLKSPLLNMN